MSLSSDFADVLSELGEPATVTRVVSGGVYDPATGGATPSVTESFTAYAVAEPYDTSEIDGTNILRTDSKITLSKIDQRPEVSDTITMDGRVYRVMMVYPVRFSGADVVYQVQGRV